MSKNPGHFHNYTASNGYLLRAKQSDENKIDAKVDEMSKEQEENEINASCELTSLSYSTVHFGPLKE